jgi:RimJ/RimL family protein N-acetyltransferase
MEKTEKIFNLQPEILENELIKIIPLTENDFDRLYAVASDPLIWVMHPITDRYKKEVFKGFFDSAIESKGAFLVLDKRTGEVIGSTRFYDLQPDYSKVIIGYTFLGRKYWGGDYNKAMKKLLIDYAFNFVDTVVFHIGITNYRSQKAILKIGAKKIDDDKLFNIGELPHYIYEIRKVDWTG